MHKQIDRYLNNNDNVVVVQHIIKIPLSEIKI